MEWPSTRVPYGGLFHPPKATFNPATRDFLKVLINESKLSISVREKDKHDLKMKQKTPSHSYAPSLRSLSESRMIIREPIKIRPGSSKRRSHDAIINSGAYVREKFVPKFPKVDGNKAKRHLQDVMAYGKDLQPPVPPKVKQLPKTDKQPENRFDQLVREIQERKDFLEEMRELGEGHKYELIIEQQIQAKLREMKKLEIGDKKQNKKK